MTTATSTQPTKGLSSAQPQTLAQRLSRSSLKGPRLSSSTRDGSDTEDDQERTPRQHHLTIGPRSSSDTLRAKESAASAVNGSSSTSTPLSRTSRTLPVANGNRPTAPSAANNNNNTASSTSKFGLGSKQKRQQRQEQDREEQRLKDEATEALRKKHGEYRPPGHSQGQIHTHRTQPSHLERSRSTGNTTFQYQPSRSQSSIKLVNNPLGPMSPVSPSPSPTPSSASSSYSSRHSRPTSPTRGMTPLVMDYGHANLHMKDLKDLDAEGMLSEHWESDGDSEQERERELASHGYGRDKSHRRGESMDTDSSYRTNNSSVVRFDLGPESETSRASSRRARRKRESNRSEVSVDTINNTRSSRRKDSEDQSQHAFLEMEEVGKPNNHSWSHRNKSTTGIVTGLAPEIDAQSIVRSHSSLSRHPTQTRPRDPRIEKYLYHSRANSPADSSAPSSASNHRSRSRSRHRQYQYQHIQAPFSDRGTMSDMTPTPSELDAMRSKAGSRAAGTLRGTTLGGSGDASSVYGTEMTQADEHNYLAPLPPFQQGPAYAKVPKRRFCKWCFGGCRWWVLLMLIIIPAGIAAVIAAFFLHQFYICFPVNPNSVDPYVYTIDPTAVQNLILDYQTQTKGNIAIIDSPNANETNILLKLQRRFYQMKYSQDLTGFQIETLPNGTVHYVLNDIADSHRKFYLSTVLCSTSILTIEMPRAALGRPEISIDAFVDQQDVLVDLDETVARNSTWRFKGISDHSLLVKSLNVNALSVSYTSTSPSTLNLASVIVRDQLSVVSVSGDIQVSVGFSNLSPSKSNTSSPSTVNLNTLDGNIQLDMKAWNQSSTFQVSSPNVQVSKAGQVLLPYTSGRNGTSVNYNGLIANAGPNSVSGSYVPQQYADTHWTQPTLSASNTLTKTATGTAPIATMTTSVKPPYSTTSGTKSGTATVTATVTTTAIGATPTAPAPPPGPALGAGGSSIPAQFIIQANKDVSVNFP